MPKFQYSVTDSKGKQLTGEIEADNTVSAINILRGKGYTPTSVVPASGAKKDDRSFLTKSAGKKDKPQSLLARLDKMLVGGVPQKTLTIFSRQLAVLIDAGLPLLRSLRVLSEQEKNRALKDAVEKLSESVEGGSTFSEALGRLPKIFDRLFVNMVRAGEIGGVLDEILNRLAEFMEKIERLKSRVKAAMIYPALVLVFAGGILSFLIAVIIPKFADIFLEMDIDLPTMTAVLIDFSNFAKTRWYIFILIIALIIASIKMLIKTEKGRWYYDKFKLTMPIFGILLRKVAIARFARTLGTLISSGVPILQALSIIRETVGNEVIGRAVLQVHDSIREGESIVGPLKASGVFPPMVVSMIDVGEETGNLSEMLLKVSDVYDEEVDVAVQGLTSVLEPILIITLAFIVGFIVIAMFLPLIKLMQGIA